MRNPIFIFIILLTTIALAGCNRLPSTFSTPTATLAPSETLVPVLPSETPLPLATPTPLPTPTAYQPITGKILFDDMRLRKGPGFLFGTIDLYPINQSVQVLGRSPGNNWFYVKTGDNLSGWMKVQGIELEGYLYDAPEVTPGDAIMIQGRVFAPNGSPASELSVMAHPEGVSTDTSLQDVSMTDVTGRFYLFLPPSTIGNWTILVNGYSCKGNNVTKECALIGKFPPEQVVSLPEGAGTSLEFKLLP